ncbi:TetR/AcrR family transcriptional regulator [Kitasatospora sp. NPDC001603]|uniref:TetR/AcrR family transcriptional regulator n=1 Tax=Kitasatospora sp. NPDC001603 TaxID=3154388 RepID=UPI00332C2B3D
MMMQERAARTRQNLVSAAAGEFDRDGYAGASLARIARSAGITTGALTFHFQSKEEMAAVVRTQGHAVTQAVVGQVTARSEPPVQSVISLTLALADLLEREAVVRAAARLAREQPGEPDWSTTWAPVIHERLQATHEAELGPYGDRSTLATLAGYLVTGAESCIRQRACRKEPLDGQSVEHISRIWELLSCGDRCLT